MPQTNRNKHSFPCRLCGEEGATFHCGRCNDKENASYCNNECQSKDWASHKKSCFTEKERNMEETVRVFEQHFASTALSGEDSKKVSELKDAYTSWW